MERSNDGRPSARKVSVNGRMAASRRQGQELRGKDNIKSITSNRGEDTAKRPASRKPARTGQTSVPTEQPAVEPVDSDVGKSCSSSLIARVGPQATISLDQESIELVVHWPAGSPVDDIYAQIYGPLGEGLKAAIMDAAPSEGYTHIGGPRFTKKRIYPVGSQGLLALDVTLMVPGGCTSRILKSPRVANGRLRVGAIRLSPNSAPIEVEFMVKNFHKEQPYPWLVRGIPPHLVGSGVTAFLADVHTATLHG